MNDLLSIKQDEQRFRALIGNTPDSPKKAFTPNGLEGDSRTFYKNERSGICYLKRWSSGEEISIVDYITQTQSLSD